MRKGVGEGVCGWGEGEEEGGREGGRVCVGE